MPRSLASQRRSGPCRSCFRAESRRSISQRRMNGIGPKRWPRRTPAFMSCARSRSRPACRMPGDMVDACSRAGVVLATNHHLRNGAIAGRMREIISAGGIGRPLVARIVPAGYLAEHLHRWRLHDARAGAGAILDLTVHDADLLRFILDDEPEAATAFAQNGGLAAAGIEDAALSLIRFRSGLLAQLFDGFTTRYAETGVEVHGSEGLLIARDCLSQTPRGTLALRSSAGEKMIPLNHHNYYVPGVRAFHDAIAGRGRPTATGEDGLISLAVALAAQESADSGRSARGLIGAKRETRRTMMRTFQEGAAMQVAMVVRDMEAAMKRHWDVFKIGPW